MPKAKDEKESKVKASSPGKAKPENGSAARPGSWRPEDKLKILDAVLANARGVDWHALAAEMGRPKSQVWDQWRKLMIKDLRSHYGGT